MKLRYLINLSESEGSWVNAFRVGEWVHELYGKISVTPKTLKTIYDNFKNDLLGHELAIDYQHSTGNPNVPPEKNGLAAGWVKDMKIEGDRLYIFVDWLKEAAEAIKSGAWKYFSPTFDPEHNSKETGKAVGITLLGGALTNTPFLTDLDPVLLSENITAELEAKAIIYKLNNIITKEPSMELGKLTPEALAVFADVFDKTEGELTAKLEEAFKSASAYVPEEKKEEPPAEEIPEAKEASEPSEAEKILASENAGLKRQLKEKEIKETINRLKAPGKYGLSENILSKLEKVINSEDGIVKLSEKQSFTSHLDALVNLIDEIKSEGLVNLAELAQAKSQEKPLEVTDEIRAKYPEGTEDKKILLSELTKIKFAELPKEKQTPQAYQKIGREVTKELTKE